MEGLEDEADLGVAQPARWRGRRGRPTSRPSRVTPPFDGTSSRPIRCSSVLLPQPEGPMIASSSPARHLEVHVRERHGLDAVGAVDLLDLRERDRRLARVAAPCDSLDRQRRHLASSPGPPAATRGIPRRLSDPQLPRVQVVRHVRDDHHVARGATPRAPRSGSGSPRRAGPGAARRRRPRTTNALCTPSPVANGPRPTRSTRALRSVSTSTSTRRFGRSTGRDLSASDDGERQHAVADRRVDRGDGALAASPRRPSTRAGRPSAIRPAFRSETVASTRNAERSATRAIGVALAHRRALLGEGPGHDAVAVRPRRARARARARPSARRLRRLAASSASPSISTSVDVAREPPRRRPAASARSPPAPRRARPPSAPGRRCSPAS